MLKPRVHPFKSREPALRALKAFVLLRPIVTLRFLRAVWYFYLTAQVLRLLGLMWGFSAIRASWGQWLLVLSGAIYPVLNILIVRVLLEAAAVVLLGHAYRTHDEAREQDRGSG